MKPVLAQKLIAAMPKAVNLVALSILIIFIGCKNKDQIRDDPMAKYCKDPHIQPSAICYKIMEEVNNFSEQRQEWGRIDSMVKCGVSMKSSKVVNTAVGVYMLNTLRCDSVSAVELNKHKFVSQADREYNQGIIKLGCRDGK